MYQPPTTGLVRFNRYLVRPCIEGFELVGLADDGYEERIQAGRTEQGMRELYSMITGHLSLQEADADGALPGPVEMKQVISLQGYLQKARAEIATLARTEPLGRLVRLLDGALAT